MHFNHFPERGRVQAISFETHYNRLHTHTIPHNTKATHQADGEK